MSGASVSTGGTPTGGTGPPAVVAPPGAGESQPSGPERMTKVLERLPAFVRDRPGLAIAGFICLAYVLMRLATMWRFPPYSDEVEYAGFALTAHLDPSQRFISLLDRKGPMLTWLSLPLLDVSDSEPLTAVRLVSAFGGLVTVVMTGLVGRELFGRTIGLVAMAVVAFLPYTVAEGALGIHEPLVTAAGTCVLYLAIRLARRPQLDFALLLGAALGAGVLTKSSGSFALVLMPLVLLLMFDWAGPARVRRAAALAGFVAIALFITYLAYSLQKLSPNFYGREDLREALRHNYSISYAFENLGTVLGQNWPSYRVQLRDYITIPLVWVGALGGAWMLRTNWRAGLVLVPWAFLPIAASTLIANKPLGRYYLPALPAMSLLIAFGLVAGVALLGRFVADPTRRRRLAAVAVGLAILPAVVFDARILATPETTELPAFEDREIIVDASSGAGWDEIERDIRSYGTASPIAVVPRLGTPLTLAFGSPSSHPVVRVDDEAAADAKFLVDSGGAMPAPCTAPGQRDCSLLDADRFTLKRVVHRPRDGTDLRFYVRDDAR